MLCSRSWALKPSPTVMDPCGSKSTRSTLRPASTSAAPRLIVVVVLPTPPFWLHIEMTVAGCPGLRGSGFGNLGIGRPVGPTSLLIYVLRPRPSTCASLYRSPYGPWMSRRVNLPKFLDGDQGVDLSRRHRGVTEQLLDDADVCTTVDQVRRERVPEGVRRHLCGDAGTLRRLGQHGPGALPAQPSSPGIQEQRRGCRLGRDECRAGHGQVVLDGGQREAAHRNEPLLATLAAEQRGALGEVEI